MWGAKDMIEHKWLYVRAKGVGGVADQTSSEDELTGYQFMQWESATPVYHLFLKSSAIRAPSSLHKNASETGAHCRSIFMVHM